MTVSMDPHTEALPTSVNADQQACFETLKSSLSQSKKKFAPASIRFLGASPANQGWHLLSVLLEGDTKVFYVNPDRRRIQDFES